MATSGDEGVVARLTRLDPREVWQHEALGFTPWLARNLDALGDALGMDLEHVETEAAVGSFSADIVARDLNRQRLVLIENQLEQSDHGHLGQLITYAAGMDAGAVVWICREVRDEHRQALDWLNQHTDEEIDFFGVALELVRIDTSRPAINFRTAAAPNSWGQQTRARVAGAQTERGTLYQAFFQSLIDELRTRHHFTNATTAQPQNWYTFASGVTGLHYGFSFARNERARAELYIDTPDEGLNKAIFDLLRERQQELEAAFGDAFAWERLDSRRASRIAVYRPASSILTTPGHELQAWAIEKLLKFKQVFGPRLSSAVDEARSRLAMAGRTQANPADTLEGAL